MNHLTIKKIRKINITKPCKHFIPINKIIVKNLLQMYLYLIIYLERSTLKAKVFYIKNIIQENRKTKSFRIDDEIISKYLKTSGQMSPKKKQKNKSNLSLRNIPKIEEQKVTLNYFKENISDFFKDKQSKKGRSLSGEPQKNLGLSNQPTNIYSKKSIDPIFIYSEISEGDFLIF